MVEDGSELAAACEAGGLAQMTGGYLQERKKNLINL